MKWIAKLRPGGGLDYCQLQLCIRISKTLNLWNKTNRKTCVIYV